MDFQIMTHDDDPIASIADAEIIFESYLSGYIDGAKDKTYTREMKQDIRMMRRIIAEIKAFRKRMEELHSIEAPK